jgi:hypothetical protein
MHNILQTCLIVLKAQHTFHDENIISSMATTVTMSHIFPHYDFSLEATGHEKI